nr:LCP family protein [Brevibacterium daeguense]
MKEANRARALFDDSSRKFADEQAFPPADVRPEPTDATSLLIRVLVGSEGAGASAAMSEGDIFALLHVPANRSGAFVLVFNPRTEVERSATLGGLAEEAGWPVYVAVVEEFLGHRVDHVMALDFAALEAVIDQVGPVPVYSRSAFAAAGRQYVEGTNQLDGGSARLFTAADPIDDAGQTRTRNQRALLRALVSGLNFGKLAKTPAELFSILSHVAAGAWTDAQLTTGSLLSIAAGMRGISQNDIITVTVPAKSQREEDGRVSVKFDEEAVPALRSALRGPDAATYVREIAKLGY